ncbi:hypothetical protein FACS1894167_01890 [Synergistales bacterium]|nr:hypothetical protein FACS1894167_01890 [Synergistales bacterium]
MREPVINSTDVLDIAAIKEKLAPVFRENGVRSAVLFGSYAKGSADSNSDVDILVDSGLRGLSFVGLIGFVRETLQKEVDMIDVHYVRKGSPVDIEIRNTGMTIYGG